MRNKIFSLILVILLLAGCGIIFKEQNKVSVAEKRFLKNKNDIEISNRLSKTTEEVLKDQFYYRDDIINTYYTLKVIVSRAFNPATTYSTILGDISLRYLSEEVSELDGGYLIPEVPEYSEDVIDSAASRGYNVREFALKYPKIKTYVYYPTRVDEFLNPNHLSETLTRDAHKAQLVDIESDYLKLNSLSDYKNYFFKTEDHWNAFGAYQGYQDVINMMSNNFNIDKPREIDEIINYPYKFKGNISTKIGSYGSYDNIVDLKLNGIGDFDYYRDEELYDYYFEKETYQKEGNLSFLSDYEFYFGANAFNRVFDFHQEDKPNLLIFGDSYINTNMMWIASHFNKTYILDLRSKPEDFSLKAYIKDKDIDAALVLMSYNTMYLNGYMYIPLD